MEKNNSSTNNTNVILNSTSKGCKAEPYPFIASAEFQDLNKAIGEKKSAFTLAETLITLCIIGVVAAMTIPTLMAKYQQRSNAIQWRKTFSMLSQATKMMQEEEELPFYEENFDSQEEYEYVLASLFAKYLKTGAVCHSKKYVEEGCAPKAFSILNYEGKKHISDIGNWGGGASCFSLLNGGLVCFDSCIMLVDVNGYSKPNTIGKDIFSAVFDFENYTVRPAKGYRTNWGAADGVLITQDKGDGTCQKEDLGYGCSYYYLHNLP